jgi:hypothetical protein
MHDVQDTCRLALVVVETEKTDRASGVNSGDENNLG